MGPLPNDPTPWLINGGYPNHLLTGMILQVGPIIRSKSCRSSHTDGFQEKIQGLRCKTSCLIGALLIYHAENRP